MEQWLVRDHNNTNFASAKEAVNDYDLWIIE